jgi:hypothetical protein
MKTDKNFKMDKQTKRILDTIIDPTMHSLYKQMCIDAQITRERAPADRSVRLKEKETE